jgi:hypothetical protein
LHSLKEGVFFSPYSQGEPPMKRHKPTPFESQPEKEQINILRQDIAALFDIVNNLEAKDEELERNVKRLFDKLQ